MKFIVDEVNSDDKTFYVDVDGLGTVQIIATEDGIQSNIFPVHVVDEPIASAFAPINKLMEE